MSPGCFVYFFILYLQMYLRCVVCITLIFNMHLFYCLLFLFFFLYFFSILHVSIKYNRHIRVPVTLFLIGFLAHAISKTKNITVD